MFSLRGVDKREGESFSLQRTCLLPLAANYGIVSVAIVGWKVLYSMDSGVCGTLQPCISNLEDRLQGIRDN
jgi:hypothetical protein